MKKNKRVNISVFICVLLFLSLPTPKVGALQVIIQGDYLPIQIMEGQDPEGTFLGEPIPFSPHRGGWVAILGIPPDLTPGAYPILISTAGNAGTEKWIEVKEADFPESYLTVSQEMEETIRPSDEDSDTVLRRAQDEAILEEVLTGFLHLSLWTGPFIIPCEGRRTTGYGAIRYVNGELHNQHAGIDIANVTGTPVHATNHGVVGLVHDFLVYGNMVVINHGLGIFSLYAHLHKPLVEEGEMVIQGQPIGEIGSTGFSTGPHLHWEMRVGLIPLNPDQFIGNNLFEHFLR